MVAFDAVDTVATVDFEWSRKVLVTANQARLVGRQQGDPRPQTR